MSTRIHGRTQDPWEDVGEAHPRYAQSLGARHDERMPSARELLEGARSELHERSDCALDRSVETYSKGLRSRLSAVDVPKAREIERSFGDVADQLDAWGSGFVAQVAQALLGYQSQVAPVRAVLRAELQSHLKRAENARVAFVEALDEVIARRFIPTDVSVAAASEWRREHEVRAFLRGARASLSTAIEEGRDRLPSRAVENRWKLEGPRLDGRLTRTSDGDVVIAD